MPSKLDLEDLTVEFERLAEVDVKKPTYSRIFRNPDSYRRALRESTRYTGG